MKPYAEYKPTGLKWLPEVPTHWDVRHIGELFSERKTKVSDKDFAPLSVTRGGIVPQMESVAKSDDGDNRKLVRKGDFVINSRSDRKSSSGVSDLDGSVSLVNIVLTPRNQLIAPYVHYLLKSFAFAEEFYRNGHGIVADLWTTRYSEMKSISLPVPPPEEQAKIVSYLDAKTAKIDKLIKLKEREIELLQEKKQAVISHVVTRGLDPNVELVDSGVDGIGQIPKGWMVARLKDITRSNLESLSEKTSGDTRIRYIDIGSVGTGYIKIAPEEMDFAMAPSRARRLVREGDTIVSTVRTYLKSVLYISREISDCVVSTGFSVLRPNEEKVIPRFLGLMLIGDYFINAVIKDSTGVSYPAINDSKLAAIHVVVPTKEIQDQIIEFADTALQNVNCVISSCERQIALLKEYRTRLISDAVAGKIDLREVAG